MRTPFPICMCSALLLLLLTIPGTLLAWQTTAQDPPETAQQESENATAEDSGDDKIRNQVVKIFSSRRTLNISSPWERGEIKEITGSGLWLGDGKILTNAHVVIYSSQMYVQPYDSSNRIAAEPLYVSPEMDLAILQLDDASAFGEMAPLPIMTETPALRSAVQVYGYPTGGAAMSITEGIVSRIEYANYSFGARGLRIQVDAALNSGNSGGPAIVDKKVVGLVYSRLRTGDNIGYLIPGEEIQTFLDDVADEKYDGKRVVREGFQKLQNDALRQRFSLTTDQTGMVVIKTNGSDEDYPIKIDDVLTHVGEYNIDNEGMVRLDNGLRLAFPYLVPKLTGEDGTFPATIIRGRETMTVQVPTGPRPIGIIDSLKGDYPEYFVYGPLVCIEVTSEYLTAIRQLVASGSRGRASAAERMLSNLIARESPMVQRFSDQPQFEEEQLIMVGPLLPHKISKGYDGPPPSVLSTINGIKIKNMEHMVQVLRDMKDDQIKIEFAELNAPYLVFNRKDIEEAMEDILLDNGIPRQGSKELLREWNKRPDDE